jgi:hypothetical protein
MRAWFTSAAAAPEKEQEKPDSAKKPDEAGAAKAQGGFFGLSMASGECISCFNQINAEDHQLTKKIALHCR